MPMTEVAKSAIEGLKTSPSCIAIVILAGGIAYMTFLAMKDQRQLQHEELELALRACPNTYEYSQRRTE